MPAVWQEDQFVNGGLSGIEEFIGRLREVEEDVESVFDGKPRTQMALHFYDVEIIASADPVVLENNLYTTWVGQSSRKNSTNMKMFLDWQKFHKEQGLEGSLPSALYESLIRWRKATYEFGENMNPGRAFIPVEFVEDEEPQPKPAASRSRGTSSTSRSKPAEAPPAEETEDSGEASDAPAEEVTAAVLEALGEDGNTRDGLRRALFKTAALRAKVGAAGGLDTVLAYVVESGQVEESEGFYYRKEEDPI